MKLLVDMNLSPRWIVLLRGAGWEAVHWSAVGRFNAPDSEVMAYAAQHEYVVLTLDLDFSTILAATRGKKPSVVQIRTDDSHPSKIGTQVVAALRHMESELQSGALLTNRQAAYAPPAATPAIRAARLQHRTDTYQDLIGRA